MILWKTHAEWADTIYSWARGFGLNDSVLAVDDLSTSDDVEGTGGAPHTLLLFDYCYRMNVRITLADSICSAQNWRGCRGKSLFQHSRFLRRRDWPGELAQGQACRAAISTILTFRTHQRAEQFTMCRLFKGSTPGEEGVKFLSR